MGCYAKMTKIELEKISNADMHLCIEKGMRGGISYIPKWYSKANNKYCPDFDKENLKSILFTLTWIIYMEVQWVNIYHMEDLNGLKLIVKQLTEYWIKVITVYMAIFGRGFRISRKFMILIKIIQWHLKKLK